MRAPYKGRQRVAPDSLMNSEHHGIPVAGRPPGTALELSAAASHPCSALGSPGLSCLLKQRHPASFVRYRRSCTTLTGMLEAHTDDRLEGSFVSREMLAVSPVVKCGPPDYSPLALSPELADQLVRAQLRRIQQLSEHTSEICRNSPACQPPFPPHRAWTSGIGFPVTSICPVRTAGHLLSSATVPRLREPAALSDLVRIPCRTWAPGRHSDGMCAAPELKTPRKPSAAWLGATTAATSIHVALWLIASHAAVALTSLEALIASAVILTALYAPTTLSERAFRMLPWTTQQPSETTSRSPN